MMGNIAPFVVNGPPTTNTVTTTFTQDLTIGAKATPTLTLDATTTTIGTVTFAGASGNDTGTNPIGVFNARIGASTTVATRPLFSWRNNGATVGQITTAGTFFGASSSGAVTSYGLQSNTIDTNTSGVRTSGFNFLSATASGASSATYHGTYSRVNTAGAQNYTGSVLEGPASFNGVNSHTGTGTVSNSVNFRAAGTTNTGGGTITNWYGFYAVSNSSATNNYAFFSSGTMPSVFGGDVRVGTAGEGFQVKEGSNATMGSATLVAGTVTVNTTAVTANSRIFLTSNADGGTPGWVRVSARTAATSFTITSSDGADTSTVAWIIIEPA